MQVLINNIFKTIPPESNLEELMQKEALDTKRGIAVAVNGEVVPKNEWKKFKLTENANILIIKAAQGG